MQASAPADTETPLSAALGGRLVQSGSAQTCDLSVVRTREMSTEQT